MRSLGNLWDCEHLNPSPGNAVWIGWAGGNAYPIRSRLPEGQLERGLARCSLVRFQGGAALHYWGGGAARTASSGLDDGRLQPKSTIFATVPLQGYGYRSTSWKQSSTTPKRSPHSACHWMLRLAAPTAPVSVESRLPATANRTGIGFSFVPSRTRVHANQRCYHPTAPNRQ